MSKNLSFEEALKELEEIVNSLERGDVSLEDAIEAYERGSILKNQCEKRKLINFLIKICQSHSACIKNYFRLLDIQL